MKKYQSFLSENFQFLEVKFSIYLNRRVFVMFQVKNSDNFHISAYNIGCGYSLEPPRRGGSNEYPQSTFRAEIKKTNSVYPCKPQFYYIKVGFKGVNMI